MVQIPISSKLVLKALELCYENFQDSININCIWKMNICVFPEEMIPQVIFYGYIKLFWLVESRKRSKNNMEKNAKNKRLKEQ